MAVHKGDQALDFTLAGIDKKKYALREALAEGPVLAVFFKTSCPTCQYTFPFLERIFQHIQGKGGRVWAISQDDARHSFDFARKYGAHFPVLIDDYPYRLSRAYGFSYVPALFVIAGDGTVELLSQGFAKDDLEQAHARLAGGAPAALPPLFQPSEKIPAYKPG
jgi:peroxiredoxin